MCVCVCVCVCACVRVSVCVYVSYSKLVSVREIVCGWVCERENERKIIEMLFIGIYVR